MLTRDPDYTFRCDTIEKLQNRLDYLRALLNEPPIFKNIYRFAFDFARVSWVFAGNFDFFIYLIIVYILWFCFVEEVIARWLVFIREKAKWLHRHHCASGL